MLGLLDTVIRFIISFVYKDAKKKSDMLARWQAQVEALNKRTASNADISLQYDDMVREQDERLALAKKAKEAALEQEIKDMQDQMKAKSKAS